MNFIPLLPIPDFKDALRYNVVQSLVAFLRHLAAKSIIVNVDEICVHFVQSQKGRPAYDTALLTVIDQVETLMIPGSSRTGIMNLETDILFIIQLLK